MLRDQELITELLDENGIRGVDAEKVQALFQFENNITKINVNLADIIMEMVYGFDPERKAFWFDYKGYLVLTNEEADKVAATEILNNIKDFSLDFLCAYIYANEDDIYNIRQEKNANEKLLNLLKKEGNVEKFIAGAIKDHSREYFIAAKDKEEHIETVRGREYYVYRTD